MGRTSGMGEGNHRAFYDGTRVAVQIEREMCINFTHLYLRNGQSKLTNEQINRIGIGPLTEFEAI